MFRRQRALRLSQVSPTGFNAKDRRWPTGHPVTITRGPAVPRSLSRMTINLRGRWQQTNGSHVYPQPTSLNVYVLNDWAFPDDQIDTEHPPERIRRNICGLVIPDTPVQQDPKSGLYLHFYLEVVAHEHRVSGEIVAWTHGKIYPIHLSEAQTTIITPRPALSEATAP